MPQASPSSSLPFQCKWFDDRAGRALEVRFTPPSGRPRLRQPFVVLRIRSATDPAGWARAGHPNFQDDDGDFVLGVPLEGGIATIYLGWFTFSYPHDAGDAQLLFSVHDAVGGELSAPIFMAAYNARLPAGRDPSQLALIEPIIALCMAVAYADGKLTPTEQAVLHDLLEMQHDVDPSERRRLTTLLQYQPAEDLRGLATAIRYRLPAMPAEEIVNMLAAVALADGSASPEELAVMQRIVAHLDADVAILNTALADARGSAEDPHVVLGVAPGASPADLKRVYHRKLKEYHPDKYGGAPPEIQEVAHRKTVELTQAYSHLTARSHGTPEEGSPPKNRVSHEWYGVQYPLRYAVQVPVQAEFVTPSSAPQASSDNGISAQSFWTGVGMIIMAIICGGGC